MANDEIEVDAPASSESRPTGSSARGPYVVALGASAGGLGALEAFFSSTPTNSGLCYVVVTHLSPTEESALPELLGRHCTLRIVPVTDRAPLEPDVIFMLTPNKSLVLEDEVLIARDRVKLPIDGFFESLAAAKAERAIAVVLSGTGSDGTLGIKAIKEAGGVVIAQETATAQYDGMPRNAISSGLVDFVLPPRSIPEQILRWVERAERITAVVGGDREEVNPAVAFQRILYLLRTHSGRDFSLYKQNTIRRRIERRMVVQRIDTLPDYVSFLESDEGERDRLQKELLIGVTSFFRDPEAFDALRDRVIPKLKERLGVDRSLRIWVPACSTGQEAYSLAMIITEAFQESPWDLDLHVFASDLDYEAIETAREGKYPESIAAELTPERLAAFFTRERDGYRVKKDLRDRIIFATQDLTRDPPFSRLDLISCRNLMIYLEPVLQQRLLRVFHYALNAGGILFMGSSETVGDSSELFFTFDRKHKFFERRSAVVQPSRMIEFGTRPRGSKASTQGAGSPSTRPRKPSMRDVCQDALLAQFVPATVVCDDAGDIVYVYGRTGDFLEPAAGEARFNVYAMARESVKIELTRGLQKAFASNEVVRYENLAVMKSGTLTHVHLTIRPLENIPCHQRLTLISFETGDVAPLVAESPVRGPGGDTNPLAKELERELLFTKEHLRTLVEQLESSNEELKSINEELQSSNEELQSSNEELETAKEELQAVNEELITLNAELQVKIEELSSANSDLDNFLSSSSIATIFLDRNYVIARFSRSTTKVFNLIPADVGRSIGDIVSQLRYDGIMKDAEDVLQSLEVCERLVETKSGQWLSMRITPYKTVDNVIGGVVVGFLDVTEQRILELQAENLRMVLDKTGTHVFLVDQRGRLVYVSASLAQALDRTQDELVNLDSKALGLQGEDGGTVDLVQNLNEKRSWTGRLAFKTSKHKLLGEATVVSSRPRLGLSCLLTNLRPSE